MLSEFQLSTTHARILGMVFLVATLSACSLGQERIDSHEQDAAVARWKACVARAQSRQDLLSIARNSHRIETRCEGHRRDVLASYPEHMQNQVETILSQHVRSTTSAQTVRARFLDL